MNRQTPPTGIEWCDFTWNVLTGCRHGCEWNMPDGQNAVCYAKTLAESPDMEKFYPQGFAHHYFFPNRLREPLIEKKPSRIFSDSMGDFAGGWVKTEDNLRVLDVVRQAHWHTFLFLTKAPHRVHLFDWPQNAHVGVSSPPDVWGGKSTASEKTKRMYLENAAANLATVKAKGNTVWMSIEPLSFDIAPTLLELGLMGTLDWIVIGAASRGKLKAQPRPQWVINLVTMADLCGIPVFFKGNLRLNPEMGVDGRQAFPVSRTVLRKDDQQLSFDALATDWTRAPPGR